MLVNDDLKSGRTKSPSSVLYICLFVSLTLASSAAIASAMAVTSTAPPATAAISAAPSTASASTARLALILLARFLGCPAFEHCLAREPDLALRVDVGHHDGDLVAHVHDILHFVDAFGIQLGDMDESIHARQDLNERTKVRDALDFARVNVSYDCAFTQRLDAFLCD